MCICNFFSVRFEDFRGKHRAQRQKKTTTKNEKAKETVVTIYIGIIQWSDKKGENSKLHGKRLPLRVTDDAQYKEILKEGYAKLKAHHPNIITLPEKDYVLVYESQKSAMTLPEGNSDFCLKKYKHQVGKDYKAITLYLTKQADLRRKELEKVMAVFDEDSDVSDEEHLNETTVEVLAPDSPMQSTPITSNASHRTHRSHASSSSSSTLTTPPTVIPETPLRIAHCPACMAPIPMESMNKHLDSCTR